MTRFRKTDNRRISSYTTADYNPGSGTPSSTSVRVSGRMAEGRYKAISDNPVKDYYKRRANGEVILNPVSIRRELRESEPSHWYFGPHSGWGVRTFDGDVACEASVPPTADADVAAYLANVEVAKDLALIEAYAKMNSPDVLFSVFYAEREKTAAMLRRPLSGANEHFQRILRRRTLLMSRGLSLVKATAQAWLELRFGWRPFISDIEGIAKAAFHVKPVHGALLAKRGGTVLNFKKEGVQTVSFVGLTSLTRTYSWSYETKVSSGVLYRYRDLSENEWKAKCFGLGLHTVPSHIWEVIPYSWLVDYFVRVGQWIAAITPDPDVTVLGNWVSTKSANINKTMLTDAYIHITLGPVADYHQSGGSYRETLEDFNREVNRSLPSIPPMTVKPLSFYQKTDIAALLVGRLTSGLSRLRL